MAIYGLWAFIREVFPELRVSVTTVNDVNAALNFKPAQFIIDGCVILRIIWALGRWGNRFAVADENGVMALVRQLVSAMLLFVADFLDPRVKWVWVFDGPNREGPKARWKPVRRASNLNVACRLLYLSTRHGAVGQGREKLDKYVYPDFFVVQAVACMIQWDMLHRANGSRAILGPGEADYVMAFLCHVMNSVVVTSDGDIPVFTKAAAIIMPQYS